MKIKSQTTCKDAIIYKAFLVFQNNKKNLTFFLTRFSC